MPKWDRPPTPDDLFRYVWGGVNRLAAEAPVGDALARALKKAREREASSNGNGKPHGEGE